MRKLPSIEHALATVPTAPITLDELIEERCWCHNQPIHMVAWSDLDTEKLSISEIGNRKPKFDDTLLRRYYK